MYKHLRFAITQEDNNKMNWFERLTGFSESSYDDTRRQLEIDGRSLRSRVNGRTYGIGDFELVSLQEIRERAQAAGLTSGHLRFRVVLGDIRRLHSLPEYTGALFQVASQFNMLEMASPNVTPEHGVTRYEYDRTQGPACAIAAGAATIFRNYFVPVGDRDGQTSEHQLDGLEDVGAALESALGQPVAALWRMSNGYALCTESGLREISRYLDGSSCADVELLRGKLRIGLHRDVEVTDSETLPRLIVSQAFCSALPLAYCSIPQAYWRAFATWVLDAAYEATMWSAVDNLQRGGSNIVLLTSVGGGAFGNRLEWIHGSIRRSLKILADFDLDVRLVSYGPPSPEIIQIANDFA